MFHLKLVIFDGAFWWKNPLKISKFSKMPPPEGKYESWIQFYDMSPKQVILGEAF